MFSGQKHPPGKAVVPASATACRAVGLQIRLQPQRGWLKAGLRPTRAPKSQTGGSQCARCAARDDACPLTVAASFWRPPPSRPRVWPPLSWERGIREWPVLQKLGSCEQSYTDADAEIHPRLGGPNVSAAPRGMMRGPFTVAANFWRTPPSRPRAWPRAPARLASRLD